MPEFRGPSNALRSLQHEDAWRGTALEACQAGLDVTLEARAGCNPAPITPPDSTTTTTLQGPLVILFTP